MLLPFFEQNSNLRCLMVGFGGCSTRLLSESLSRFSTLREFEFSCCQLSDDDVETLVQALAGHSRLTKIHLCDNEVGARGIAAWQLLWLEIVR